MKMRVLGAALAAVLMAGAASAATVSITVLASSGDGSTPAANTSNIYAPDFAAVVPTGATMNARVVTPPPGNTSGIFRSPWGGNALQDVNSYFAVGPGVNQPNPATLTFGTAQTSFKILWGSIDRYNSLTFSGGTLGATGVTITGANLLGTPGCGTGQSLGCTALVSFSVFGDNQNQLSFDTMTFSSSSQAFEFATAVVPLPAAAWLLIGGVAALGAVGRSKRKAA